MDTIDVCPECRCAKGYTVEHYSTCRGRPPHESVSFSEFVYGTTIATESAEIARLRDELAAKERECEALKRRLDGECETCGGSGKMEGLTGHKQVGDNDPVEVYELVECGECGGSGIGWVGEIIKERDSLKSRREALKGLLLDTKRDLVDALECLMTGNDWSADVRKALARIDSEISAADGGRGEP